VIVVAVDILNIVFNFIKLNSQPKHIPRLRRALYPAYYDSIHPKTK
jgi:hypothetical protein